MFPNLNWLHVIVAAAAGFTISIVFYFLPVMQKQRAEQVATSGIESESLASAILKRLWNTCFYAFALEWFLNLTGMHSLGTGMLLLVVVLLRSALSPDGWNRDLVEPSRTVKLVDNARFILMYAAMIGILIFWR